MIQLRGSVRTTIAGLTPMTSPGPSSAKLLDMPAPLSDTSTGTVARSRVPEPPAPSRSGWSTRVPMPRRSHEAKV